MTVKLLLSGCALCVVGAAIPVWLGVAQPRPEAQDRPIASQRVLQARDSSVNHHDGINQGEVVTGLPGHRGQSYSFDVAGAWVQVPSAPDLNPGTRDFLVDAWVYFEAAPGRTGSFDIMRKGLSYSFGGEFKLEVLAGGRVKCSVKDETGVAVYVIATGHDVTDHRWHHLGCARVGSSWHAIVDGEVFSRSTRLGSVENTMPLSIGSKYGLEDVPRGRVDEVRYYARPSTGDAGPTGAAAAAEIAELAQGPAVARWHLDDGPPRVVRAPGVRSPR